MEEKRREAGIPTAASGESPASEQTSSRRRAGGQKRKSGNLSSSGSSSTPSKRGTREKSSLSHSSHPPIHNGPLTRARQAPASHSSAAASVLAAPSATGGANQAAGQAKAPGVASGEVVAGALVAEELRKESELQALEAGLEAKFEAIRSRSSSAHVVPSHCGWFSWTKIHPIEERTLLSFFNGKSESRTANIYLEIRNWIMKKFHANPNTEIGLKDLSELEIGDLDARQEVFEFLDHWGLINFHPFPPTDSASCGAGGKGDDDGAAEKASLADKLYHFETPQSSKPVVPKNSITAPAVPSGLFPESAIAEELVRVEYHCNSCSADCSRKRYHCQKQADFDLCTDCFSNGKFDSGMSSLDFILMEPGEGAGLSGGKWTDQETLLLLEALELYPENWNEIAEHVATKTKAQCILHFVQMPIEDTFLDYDDTTDSSPKENADPVSTEKDLSAPKDAGEATEGETAASENQSPPSPVETSKEETKDAKSNQDTSKPVDANEVKAGQETSKPKEDNEPRNGQETGEDCAIKALKEAFEAVGYPLTSEGPLSFAEVGNPVMALASFLARLVGPDLATASAHNSMKSISGNSPGIELAARHCFVLEDPPNDNREPAALHSVAKVANGETKKDEITSDKKGDSAPEEKTPLNAPESESQEKPNAMKEKDAIVASKEADSVDVEKPNTSETINDQSPSTLGGSDDLKSDAELPPSLVSETEGKLVEIPETIENLKDIEMSEAPSSEKNEPQQAVLLNLASESTHSAKPLENADAVSDSLPVEKNEHGVIVKSDEKSSAEAAKDVDMVPHSQQSEKTTPPQPLSANVTVENTIEDPTKDGEKEKDDSLETKEEHKIDKIKRAAVSAISAAAVKAKLLANQEEEQIRRLSTLLIEKQLQKLETKLGFFNEMENVVMRVREQMDRSRQRLYHERAQIIAARLGLPASSSRVMPSSLPANRIGVNVAGSAPRPPLGMVSQRPPMSRPIGTVAPNPSIPLPTSAGSSIPPPSQEKLSSVGTK